MHPDALSVKRWECCFLPSGFRSNPAIAPSLHESAEIVNRHADEAQRPPLFQDDLLEAKNGPLPASYGYAQSCRSATHPAPHRLPRKPRRRLDHQVEILLLQRPGDPPGRIRQLRPTAVPAPRLEHPD